LITNQVPKCKTLKTNYLNFHEYGIYSKYEILFLNLENHKIINRVISDNRFFVEHVPIG